MVADCVVHGSVATKLTGRALFASTASIAPVPLNRRRKSAASAPAAIETDNGRSRVSPPVSTTGSESEMVIEVSSGIESHAACTKVPVRISRLARMLAADWGAPLYLTSAKTGEEVETLFRHLGRLLLA